MQHLPWKRRTSFWDRPINLVAKSIRFPYTKRMMSDLSPKRALAIERWNFDLALHTINERTLHLSSGRCTHTTSTHGARDESNTISENNEKRYIHYFFEPLLKWKGENKQRRENEREKENEGKNRKRWKDIWKIKSKISKRLTNFSPFARRPSMF